MSNSKGPTPLDIRLYDWVSEPHPQRFDLAFRAYFAVAFPAVTRHLARLSRWDPAQLEELAQDALLRFFDKVGKNRRQASDLVKAALQAILPLDMGPIHERQVQNWTQDTEAFRIAVMSYRPVSALGRDDEDLKAPIRSLADRISPLQARGSHFLNAVRIALRWEADVFAEAGIFGAAERGAPLSQDSDSIEFAERFGSAAVQGSPQIVSAEERLPGVVLFVSSTATVVNALPNLRVPTNGYLFEIALTIYLDECKKRGRKKRGGSGFTSAENRDGTHPLDLLGSEFEASGEWQLTDDEVLTASATPSLDSPREPSVDPIRQFEDQEFFEKFYEYLRRPLDEAIAQYESARTLRGAKTELKRVESISNKFSRTVAVLTLLGEGNTQEQAAAQLGLSRNQVKYAAELIQETFQLFAQSSDRPESIATRHGDRPHG